MSCNLVKPSSFLQQCISIVSKFVECHDPMKYDLIDREKGVYVLCNTAHPIFVSSNPPFYVLKVKDSKALYMHVAITLKAPKQNAAIDSNHEFEGASFQFFQGKGKLFCRAEWDAKKIKYKLEHPQPHWHWGYQNETESKGFISPANDKGGFLTQFEKASIAEMPLPNVDFNELHYAMSSRWTINDSAVEEFTPPRFYEWMKRCICHVIDQYNYQSNKSGFVSAKYW